MCNEWKVSFVRCDGNKAMHYLARFTCLVDNFVLWIEDAPEQLLTFLHSDVNLAF